MRRLFPRGRLAPLLVALVSCRREAPAAPPPRAQAAQAPPPQPAAEAPAAPADDDPSWAAGTWKKDGEPRWLLFNPPAEVAELAGKPPRLARRGKLVAHGRFLSAIFPDGEVQLEATRDHAQLSASGGGVYRRGTPP